MKSRLLWLLVVASAVASLSCEKMFASVPESMTGVNKNVKNDILYNIDNTGVDGLNSIVNDCLQFNTDDSNVNAIMSKHCEQIFKIRISHEKNLKETNNHILELSMAKKALETEKSVLINRMQTAHNTIENLNTTLANVTQQYHVLWERSHHNLNVMEKMHDVHQAFTQKLQRELNDIIVDNEEALESYEKKMRRLARNDSQIIKSKDERSTKLKDALENETDATDAKIKKIEAEIELERGIKEQKEKFQKAVSTPAVKYSSMQDGAKTKSAPSSATPALDFDSLHTSSIKSGRTNSQKQMSEESLANEHSQWQWIDEPLVSNFAVYLTAAKENIVQLGEIVEDLDKFSRGNKTRSGKLLHIHPVSVQFKDWFNATKNLIYPNESFSSLSEKTPVQLFHDFWSVGPDFYINAASGFLKVLASQRQTNDVVADWLDKEQELLGNLTANDTSETEPSPFQRQTNDVVADWLDKEQELIGNWTANGTSPETEPSPNQSEDSMAVSRQQRATNEQDIGVFLEKLCMKTPKISLLKLDLTSSSGTWEFEHGIEVNIPSDVHKYSVDNKPGNLTVSSNTGELLYFVRDKPIESNKMMMQATFENGLTINRHKLSALELSVPPTRASILY